jgi:hypothetical protein
MARKRFVFTKARRLAALRNLKKARAAARRCGKRRTSRRGRR